MYVEDYAHKRKLTKIRKSSLLVESTFQLLQAASLMTQFAASHEELLLPDTSSQEVESSKFHYTIVKAKVDRFKRDYSRLCCHLDQVSHFLEEVNLHGTPANFVTSKLLIFLSMSCIPLFVTMA